MSEFNQTNWLDALSKVYERSIRDSEFRSLCLSDPVAALKAVSDIDLPSALKFQFYAEREEIVYPFLLPPALGTTDATTPGHIEEIIRWATLCTTPTHQATE